MRRQQSQSKQFDQLKKNEKGTFFSGIHFPISEVLIGTTTPDPEYFVDNRFFSRYQVFEYVLEGEGELVLEKKTFPIRAGSTIIIRSNNVHSIKQNENAPLKKIWVIFLSSNYISNMLERYRLPSGVYNISNEYNFRNLASLIKSNNDPSILFYIANNIHEIITKTASINFKFFESPANIIKSKLDSLIHEKYSLKDIASELGMSLSTFTRTFKAAFNMTPGQYILNTKINIAKSLLSSTNLPIKNISIFLNFIDEYYFTYFFTKKTGISPSAYRKQSKQKSIE